VSLLQVSIACAAAVLVFVLVAYRRGWTWTGFVAPVTPDERDSASSRGGSKTLWDWLQLLIVPVVLALAAFALNDAQTRREQRTEQARDDRARAVAADGRRQDTLDDYLQRMSELVLVHEPADSRPGSRPFALARTLTITVLGQLDPTRKRIVVQFLAETNLIRSARNSRGDRSRLLARADLRGANLQELDLSSMSLTYADLRHADLNRATLGRTNFDGARLNHATLQGAFIEDAHFYLADLRHADLTGVRTFGLPTLALISGAPA
jgi:hypothetical protein